MTISDGKKPHILFMCVANSARSQMAEGLAKKVFGGNAVIESAGSEPSKVNPLAIKTMQELGIDISKHHSKSIGDLRPKFIIQLDYVITLCSEEVCAMVPSKAKRLHWPHPDLAGKLGTEEEQLQRFRDARDAIHQKIVAFAREISST